MSVFDYSMPINYSNKFTNCDEKGFRGNASYSSIKNCVPLNINYPSNIDTKVKNIRILHCSRCQNHNEVVALKGHKRLCKYKDCGCKLCKLTIDRREISKSIAYRRNFKEEKADNCFMPSDLKKIKVSSANFDNSKEQINLQDVNQVTQTAIRISFKKILENLNEHFRSSLPKVWFETLNDLSGPNFNISQIKDQFQKEVDQMMREAAFRPVLDEISIKKVESESLKSEHQNFSKSQTAMKNSKNQILSQLLFNGNNNNQNKSLNDALNYNHSNNNKYNGQVNSPNFINVLNEPFVSSIKTKMLDTLETPQSNHANHLNPVNSILNTKNYKNLNANFIESNVNNTRIFSNLSPCNDISLTLKKKLISQYLIDKN